MLRRMSEPQDQAAMVFNSKESLFNHLLPFLDEEPEHDENLMDYGLTSIDLMELVTHLRDGGANVSFDDLARSISIDGIWICISQAHEKGAKHV